MKPPSCASSATSGVTGPTESNDIRQETYVRVYQAALTSRPTMPRNFLFATARHLITDRVRHQRVITIDTVGDLETLNVITDDLSPERYSSAHQELRVIAGHALRVGVVQRANATRTRPR